MRTINLLLDNDTDRELYKTTLIICNENKASQFVFTVPDDMAAYKCRMLLRLNEHDPASTGELTPDAEGVVTYVLTDEYTSEKGVLRIEVQFYDTASEALVKGLPIPFNVVEGIGDIPIIMQS